MQRFIDHVNEDPWNWTPAMVEEFSADLRTVNHVAHSTLRGSGRKGWRAAYRDSVTMKIAYGYGLRFNELRHLQTVDFARNPHAREFGSFGVCKVRFGKARRASPPKPRGMLSVWSRTPGILEDWLANGRG